MFFQPAIGTGGYLGWLVLERTEERQREVHDRSPTLERNIDYFRENFSHSLSAGELVDDRRLLSVVLGAFGLSEEINKKAFIEKILNDGVADDDALANRLNEPRFKAMSEFFGFGPPVDEIIIRDADFIEDVIARYKSLEFERAVGETDNDMRLALNFRREISEFAESTAEESTMWLQILGRKPVREVLSAAFGIPIEVSQLDIDRQREIFADKAKQFFGDSSKEIFGKPEVIEETIRRFFFRRQIDSGPDATTPGYAALTLLQTNSVGATAAQNLFLSSF